MDGAAEILEAYVASLAPERRQLLSRYRLVDVARKVVGVGSVGTRCWVLLMLGTSDQDPLFLQMKEAQPSVMAPYFHDHPDYTCQGQRVVEGQRLIQGSPDIFLGYGTRGDKHFYFRQLRDMKGSAEFVPGAIRRSEHSSSTAGCAAGRWRWRTRSRATPRCSPATSASPRSSPTPSSPSPWPTQTRPTATTTR